MSIPNVKAIKNNEIANALEEAITKLCKLRSEENYRTKQLERYIEALKNEIVRRLENNKTFKINLGMGDRE